MARPISITKDKILAGQNHLLQQLQAEPRYIHDSEWAELERVFRNTFNLTPLFSTAGSRRCIYKPTSSVQYS